MKMRAFAFGIFLTVLWIGGFGSVLAETTLIVCPAKNGSFEFTVDYSRKTVSSPSESAPYTVPAKIT